MDLLVNCITCATHALADNLYRVFGVAVRDLTQYLVVTPITEQATLGLPLRMTPFSASPNSSWDGLQVPVEIASHMIHNHMDDLRVSYMEDVGQLLCCGYVSQINDLIFYQTSNVMVMDVNKLCS